jgi:hypothetical protein
MFLCSQTKVRDGMRREEAVRFLSTAEVVVAEGLIDCLGTVGTVGRYTHTFVGMPSTGLDFGA